MTPFEGTNKVTSPFGPRNSPITGKQEQHRGQDITTTGSWNVRECTGGEVARVAYDASRGHYVDVQTDSNTFERYQHMQSIAVKVGQKVSQGAVVGVAGSSGAVTGRHLHFGVYRNGTKEANAINPALWSDVPNVVGTYQGNNNLDSVSEPDTSTETAPATPLYIITIGPASGGDKNTLAAIAEALGLPVAVKEA